MPLKISIFFPLWKIHILVVTVELWVKLKPPPDWHWLCILTDDGSTWSSSFSFLQISNQPPEFFLFANFKSTIGRTIFIIPDFPKLLLDYQTGYAFWHTMDRPRVGVFLFSLQISNQPPVEVFPFSRFPKIIVGLSAKSLVWHWLCNLTDDGSTSYLTFKISCWFLVVLIWTPKSLTFIR